MVESLMEMEKEGITEFHSKKLFQFLSAIAAATGTFTIGMVLAWSSPCLGEIEQDPHFEGITQDQLSWIAAFAAVGGIFSGSLAGFLFRQVGGQKSMLILCLPTIAGWILILLAENVYMIYAGRFILGLCNGAQVMLVPIYVSEISEDNIRGIATSSFAVLCALGMLFEYAVGSLVSWTTLTLISTIFPAAFMILIFFIPESPNYLISKGDKIKAQEVLMWLRGTTNPDHVQEELIYIQAIQEKINSEKVTFKDYLTPEVLKPVLMTLTILAVQQFSGITCIFFYAEQIFASAKTSLDAELCTIIMGVVNVICAFIFAFLVEKLGRKFLLGISCFACALSLFALGTYFYMKNHQMDTSSLNSLPISALLIYNIVFGFGLGPVPWVLMPEILPQKVVGSASGLALTFNWILAFLLSKTFGTFVNLLGEEGCFWMFGGVCILGATFTALFIPETKGRKLEDIQLEFKSA